MTLSDGATVGVCVLLTDALVALGNPAERVVAVLYKLNITIKFGDRNGRGLTAWTAGRAACAIALRSMAWRTMRRRWWTMAKKVTGILVQKMWASAEPGAVESSYRSPRGLAWKYALVAFISIGRECKRRTTAFASFRRTLVTERVSSRSSFLLRPDID